HAERGVVRVAVVHEDVGRRDAELVGDDLGEGRLVALTLRLGADLEYGLAARVHPELGAVEHLDADDVELPAVAGAERLGHGGDTDADVAPVLAGLGLLPAEVLVPE